MHVHWHRRDLRPTDNRPLADATAEGPIVPVFVFDPAILTHASNVRTACLLDALAALRSWYRDRGSDLHVARGDPAAVLPAIAEEYGAESVGWGLDYSGLANERDLATRTALEDAGVRRRSVHDAVLHEPGTISPNQGAHYSVFSYFWKKWRDREKADPAPAPDAADLAAIDGRALPSLADLGFDDPEADPPTVTPAAARERLDDFCESDVYRYADRRDDPAADATSRLSVHLKYGTIGVRSVYAATERAMDAAGDELERESVEAFQRQLAWREFYAHVLSFNPETVEENFSPYENEIEWRNDPKELAAWKAGETGYPIVDAGMRQLLAEAWVHNRVRMLAASFLTKDLLIDWRYGYAHYREKLADHDTANDVGGWQWAASTGTDAQPYFRVFNPMKQGREYDPEAEYIRKYVSELADVPAATVHRWHELDDDEREAHAPAYPEPIVDHGERRKRAIETFERARGE